jgi:hypothetical protein
MPPHKPAHFTVKRNARLSVSSRLVLPIGIETKLTDSEVFQEDGEPVSLVKKGASLVSWGWIMPYGSNLVNCPKG